MAKKLIAALGVASLVLVVSLAAAGLALGLSGAVSKGKLADVVKVLRGALKSPAEAEGAAPADAGAKPAGGIEMKSEEELGQAVAEWEKEKRGQEEAIAAERDALKSMQRELGAVRIELDARQKKFNATVKAYDEAKAADEAAERSQGFRDAVATYERMEARDVAQLLYALADDEVVRFLRAFKVNFRAEVLTEIKKVDDASPLAGRGNVNRAARLQELISGGDAAAVAGAANGAEK